MPRVSSEKTRQVILVKDPVFDDTQIPERLALFDEDLQMVSINLVNKGVWVPTAAYAENDIVTHDGGSYLAKQPIAANLEGNETPDVDTTTWSVLAEKGTPGIIGLTWQDEWEVGKQYVYRDAVARLGSSYMARYDNIGQPPETPPGAVYAPASYLGGTYAAAELIESDNTADQVDTPSGSTISWFRFDVDTAATFTAVVDAISGGDPYLGITNAAGAYVTGGGPVRARSIAVALTPGRYYVRLQQFTTGQSAPWRVTLTPAASLGEPVGPPWLLLAERGTDGDDGPQGIQGIQGVPGPIANWRGEFVAGAAYEKGDSVYYDGESWWCTDDMAAGTAPTPSDVIVLAHIGDSPSTSGTQHVYELPLEHEVVWPLANRTSNFSVASADGTSSWFRVHAEPGSTLTVHAGVGRVTIFKSDGLYANRYPGKENVGGDHTVVMDANGIVWLEFAAVTAGTFPVLMVEGNSHPSYAIPTWAKIVQKGADGADGATGPEGPEGPEGPAGSPGLGSGGYGLPLGGVADDVLVKQSGTDGDAAWETPVAPPTGIIIHREKNDASVAIAAGTNLVTDTLTFTLAEPRLVHLFGHVGHSDPPSSHTFDFALNDVSIAQGGNNSSAVTGYTLIQSTGGNVAVSGGYSPVILDNPGEGIRRILPAGTHTLKHRTTRGSGGGTIEKRLLMAVIYDTPITDQ